MLNTKKYLIPLTIVYSIMILIPLNLMAGIFDSEPESIEPLDSNITENQTDEIRDIVRQVRLGEPDYIRMMEYSVFNRTFTPIEEKIQSYNEANPNSPVHFFNNRLFRESGVISFTYGLHNMDYRIRNRIITILLQYVQTAAADDVNGPFIKEELDKALERETVRETEQAMRMLKKRLIRRDWEIRLEREKDQNPELFKEIGLTDFMVLAEPFLNEPSLLHELGDDYIPVLIPGLENVNIRIRFECSKHLMRIARSYAESDDHSRDDMGNILLIQEAFVKAKQAADEINLQLGAIYYENLNLGHIDQIINYQETGDTPAFIRQEQMEAERARRRAAEEARAAAAAAEETAEKPEETADTTDNSEEEDGKEAVEDAEFADTDRTDQHVEESE